MSRSIGGVQWRSDNTRGLRLGEQISAFILAKVTVELEERPLQGRATIDPRVTVL